MEKVIRYCQAKDLAPILNNERPMSSYKLKNLLIKLGMKEYRCERCGLSEWNKSPVPLELHHKDGNHYNNQLENLAIICPNCHAMEPNFCYKNKHIDVSIANILKLGQESSTYSEVARKLGVRGTGQTFYKIKKILNTNGIDYKEEAKIVREEKEVMATQEKTAKIYKKKTKYSSAEEAWAASCKATWPDDVTLEQLIWEKSTAQIGKLLGVSDNAVRRRCKSRGIPMPPVGWHRKREVGQKEYCDQIEHEMRVANRPIPTSKKFQ